MSTILKRGGANDELTDADVSEFVREFIGRASGKPRKVLLIPPDYSRFHGGAGPICAQLYCHYSVAATVHLLPALGTHRPMTPAEIRSMFPGVPEDKVLVHDWRRGLATLGEIPGSRLKALSEGRVSYPIRVEIDRLIVEGGYDLVISTGQVVPHEVAGMAGGNKNVLVGASGPDMINKSHFLGAVCNMERIMGQMDNPVRTLFNEAEAEFLGQFKIQYIITVRARNGAGRLVTRGLFAGPGLPPYEAAARLSQKVNIETVRPLKKTVVFLDPAEFKSTWLGNKAIYRTRMAMADRGELLIIAPGLVEFGEAEVNERLIRKYGYRGTPATLKAVEENEDLRDSLGAAAHLIHGSSEGRFTITYASGGLTRREIEAVGFNSADFQSALKRYPPDVLKDGFQTLPDGEEIFYISNPALGLWRRE